MGERDAFGPNLRRARIQRGVTLDAIAAATKISTDLLSGLEQNDFSRWPTGIYARAYIRAYATEIGVDPEGVVDDFCRWFPQGDRRAERVVRDQAAMVGHDLRWKDDLVGAVVDRDRRSRSRAHYTPMLVMAQRTRLLAAVVDQAAVIGIGLAAAALLPIGRAAAIAVTALVYHGVMLAAIGCTPAVWAIDTYLMSRHPAARRSGAEPTLRVLRSSSERAKV
jgi:transcriptional regulator with XRE-family HTH domain